MVAIKPLDSLTSTCRSMEGHPIESQHNIIRRLKLPLGQHGLDRHPSSLTSTKLQPTILDRQPILQLPSGQRTHPIPPSTQHARSMWRECWLWWIRMGSVSRICYNDVTIKAQYFFSPLLVLGHHRTLAAWGISAFASAIERFPVHNVISFVLDV